MKHLIIINPIAGGKNVRFDDTMQKAKAFVSDLGDPYEIYVTKAPLDAMQKVTSDALVNDNLYVYACGGDGTLNECANGAANKPNVAIAPYACGTGNDFVRMFGNEHTDIFRDFSAISRGSVRPFDLIECNGRYGINICSVGIDARIGGDVHKYSKIPLIGGATGYIVSTIVNLIKGINQTLTITIDGKSETKSVSMICACNGRFYGGGFNPVPDAMPDDGFIDLLIVDALSRLKVPSVIGKYAKGQYRELSDIITHIKLQRLDIESDTGFVLNLDGETTVTQNASFRIAPHAVRFLMPAGVIF